MTDNAKVLHTGVVAVSRVDDAKHVVSSCRLLTVPVLVDEPGSTAPLLQFREHFPLQITNKSLKIKATKLSLCLTSQINLEIMSKRQHCFG